jgi:hypothetical protein
MMRLGSDKVFNASEWKNEYRQMCVDEWLNLDYSTDALDSGIRTAKRLSNRSAPQ